MADTLQDAARRELARRELARRGITPPPDPFGQSGAVDVSQPYNGKINPARAAILGGSQGMTLGYGEEIGAALGSLARKSEPGMLGPAFALAPDDTPELRAFKLKALDAELASRLKDPLSYEGLRDAQRAELAQAQQQRPREYMAGEMAGSLMTAALPGGRPNMSGSALRNAVRLLGSGAGAGAVSGVGASNAPLDSPETLSAAGKGAAAGLGGALAGAAIGKGAPLLLRALGRGAEKGAVDATRRVMLSGAKQLGDKGRVKMPDEVPLQVLKEGAIVPFGTTEGTLGRITAARQAQSKTYGEIIETLERAGVPGPNARALADRLLAQAAAEEPRTMIKAIPDLYRGQAEEVISKSVLGEQAGIAPTGRLGLGQAEDLKRSLQTQARYGKIEDTPVNEARQDIASMVRQANEDAVKAGARPLPDDAYLYHVTPESNVPSIRQQGLRPDAPKIAEGGPHGDTQAVFLADQGSVPIYEDLYGGGAEGLAVFRAPRRALSGLTADTASEGAAWMTPHGIAPERLQMRNAAGGWDDVVPGTTAGIQEAVESFVPVKQRLGRLIEAERATRQGVQRASTRGSGPGVVEMSAATASGNPAPLFGRLALNAARNRGPSTMAATLYPLSRGLTGAGNLMSRVPVAARMAGGAGLGAAAGRALAMRTEPPLPPEPPPEGADLDLERWRLEQELRGQSRPSGAPLRRLVKKGRK